MGRIHLHKFGGSSLADADCYRRVVHILLTHGHSDDLVVVSAAGKTTNALYRLLALKQTGELWQQSLDELCSYQQELIEQLLSHEQAQSLRERLSSDKSQLISILKLSNISQYRQNQLLSFGERWSAQLMAALLRESGVAARHLDACQVLVAEDGPVPQIKTDISRQKLQQFLTEYPEQRIVITGFICANEQGDTLLLGRNGSDYSATLLASLANIGRVTIWTDVEGIFNADPNKITDAKLLHNLSLNEADKLAHLGSPVLHSRTLKPLFDTQVSLAVRSSYAPQTEFSLISPQTDAASAPVVTNLGQVCLFSLQLAGNIDELKRAFSDAEMLPLGYWQYGANDVSFACTMESQQQYSDFLNQHHQTLGINYFSQQDNYGLVALVSADANLYRRSFARLLSREALPLYQDPLSLVTLVPIKQVNVLTQKVHRRCAGPRKRIGVVLFGLGNIGQAWLSLFEQAVTSLNHELEASVELVGLVNSRQALLSDQAIDLGHWQSQFKQQAQAWQYPTLLTQLSQLSADELVVLDISASEQLSAQYPAFFKHGIHIVSANKLAGSGPLDFYNSLLQRLANRRLFWRYNASCGAGLPVQHALNDLHNSGDKVAAVGGIFSGTLCWLFEHYDGHVPFSQLVLQAKALGITEPDPRDDLSGKDMQRKLLILAREIGLNIELNDIELESLVPCELAQVSVTEFLANISRLDETMLAQFRQAQSDNKVLRYVASLDLTDDKVSAKVAVEAVALDHPYANLTPGDNVFVIRSGFYRDNPLIIRGPGAGREVTAAAVQSDLAHICRDLLQE